MAGMMEQLREKRQKDHNYSIAIIFFLTLPKSLCYPVNKTSREDLTYENDSNFNRGLALFEGSHPR